MRKASILILGFSVILAGQFVRGTIQGIVTDSTGAVIPGVQVTLTNLGTNEVRITRSDERGDYTFPALLPGRYSVQSEMPAFKTQVVTNIELQVNQTARVDLMLPVGEVSERIQVAAEAILLKTDTSEVGQVLTNKQIIELPLNGRDFLQLARLAPGAIPSRAGATLGRKGVNRSVNVAGARDTSIAFLLDGVDINDVSFQVPTVTPSIDAIQEFKLLENAYTAEFGRGATQVIAALKSGTNQWHGSLFEFLRHDKLASRSFFDLNRPAQLKQNQFGAAVGGPLTVPKLYSGKDRTFFFANYEGQRIRVRQIGYALVPTPEQLAGDFAAPGNPRIYDSLTFDPAARTRQPFPENRIPSTRFSPRAVKVASLFQKPNFAGLVGRNYVNTPLVVHDNNQGNLRIDHRFSSKDNVFARYSILETFRTRPGVIPDTGTFDDVRGQNAALNWTRTVRPDLLNEVRVAVNRAYNLEPPVYSGAQGRNPARDFFGFSNTTTDPVLGFGLPGFSFAGGFAGLGSSDPLHYITYTQQLVDNVTLLRGAHTVKVGLDVRRQRLTMIFGGNDRGSVGFLPQFTNQPGVSNTGSSIADLLLGFPQTADIAGGDRVGHNYSELYGLYFQEDWKISRRLTLNLGIRYEYISPWREKLSQYTTLDFADAAGRLLIASGSKAFIPGRGVVDSGGPPISRTIIPPDTNNWAPRVGFAWRPLAKTVLRGGYGVFYDVQEGNEVQFLRTNPPFTFRQNQTADPFVPTIRLDELFGPLRVGPAGYLGAAGGETVFSVDPSSMRTPYVQQWNLNVEREVAPNLLVEVGYLGSKGTHLLRRSNFQQGERILVQDPRNPAPRRQRVRFPNFSLQSILGTENAASSTYHGLLGKVERRFSGGLGVLASYTFSRTIDDTHSSSNFDNTPQNPQCRCDFGSEKGPSAFHLKHRLVFSYSYQLPFGRGKRIGGWQLNGITAVQSGPAFTVNTTGDNADIGVGSGSSNNQRPNLVGDPYAGIDRSASAQQRGVNAGTYWFNRAAFVVPPLFRLGDLGRNTLYAPGLHNWDFSVFKNTAITEQVAAQFRAEFFNTFNHPNFGVPGRVLGTPTFGVITGAGPGRIIQFGLKILF
ncbi:MAG: TonB-dependent receptor [Acidobacteria bacterium]|nr:TonB-dependent receptor [Acidobacteriota bacterium]